MARFPSGSAPLALDLRQRKRARVIVLSDTHGFLDPRIAEVAKGADAVVHGGDIGGDDVLEALAGPPLVVITGNNDVAAKWSGDPGALAALDEAASLALPGGHLVVEHGHRAGAAKGRHQRLRARYPQARAVIYGHSHRLCVDDAETPWVLNPGAAGRVRTYGGPSYIDLVATAADWRAEAVRLEPFASGRHPSRRRATKE